MFESIRLQYRKPSPAKKVAPHPAVCKTARLLKRLESGRIQLPAPLFKRRARS
jgi:hypothetical protein